MNSIPAAVGFSDKGSSVPIETAWGVATSGTLLFNGISGEGVDPFYPAEYGKCSEAGGKFDVSECVEKIDKCLVHPNPGQGILHYHSAGTCMADPSISNTAGAKVDIVKFIASSWAKKPYRTALGLSKDGRVIYSPLYNNGSTYESCDVDLCNGRMIGG